MMFYSLLLLLVVLVYSDFKVNYSIFVFVSNETAVVVFTSVISRVHACVTLHGPMIIGKLFVHHALCLCVVL